MVKGSLASITNEVLNMETESYLLDILKVRPGEHCTNPGSALSLPRKNLNGIK